MNFSNRIQTSSLPLLEVLTVNYWEAAQSGVVRPDQDINTSNAFGIYAPRRI